MNLHFVDLEPDVVAALQDAFEPFPEVRILREDILNIATCAVVSPANSYGFMDGGIDLAYTRFFGRRPETELQDAIAQLPDGHLKVGSAMLVTTGHVRIPYLVSAPTMQLPSRIPPQNCFYAMAATLNLARKHADIISDLYCPGLGTGVGCVEPEDAAREMFNAYKKWRAAV